MPMNEFWCVGVVVHVHDDALTLLKSQQRTGKLTVVERGRYDVLGREFDEAGGDPQRVVGLYGRIGCVLDAIARQGPQPGRRTGVGLGE